MELVRKRIMDKTQESLKKEVILWIMAALWGFIFVFFASIVFKGLWLAAKFGWNIL